MTEEKNNLGAPAQVEAIMGGKAIEMENIKGLSLDFLDVLIDWLENEFHIKVNLTTDYECFDVFYSCFREAKGEYVVRTSANYVARAWAGYLLLKMIEEDKYLQIKSVEWERVKVYNNKDILVDEFLYPVFVRIQLLEADK
jgi:hypothetical protein